MIFLQIKAHSSDQSVLRMLGFSDLFEISLSLLSSSNRNVAFAALHLLTNICTDMNELAPTLDALNIVPYLYPYLLTEINNTATFLEQTFTPSQTPVDSPPTDITSDSSPTMLPDESMQIPEFLSDTEILPLEEYSHLTALKQLLSTILVVIHFSAQNHTPLTSGEGASRADILFWSTCLLLTQPLTKILSFHKYLPINKELKKISNETDERRRVQYNQLLYSEDTTPTERADESPSSHQTKHKKKHHSTQNKNTKRGARLTDIDTRNLFHLMQQSLYLLRSIISWDPDFAVVCHIVFLYFFLCFFVPSFSPYRSSSFTLLSFFSLSVFISISISLYLSFSTLRRA